MTEQAYFQGRRTPDGPMVTRHDPPDFEGVVMPEPDYDWGEFNYGCLLLAQDILTSAWGARPWPLERDDFAAWVLSSLDREDDWKLTLGQVLTWNDKEGRDREEGR